MRRDQELDILYTALNARYGIIVRSAEDGFRDHVIAARNKLMKEDPAIHDLSIVRCPHDPTALWLFKKGLPNAGN